MGNKFSIVLTTATLTVGFLGAVLFASGLLNTGNISPSEAASKKTQSGASLVSDGAQGETSLTLLGDTFSGYSTFRNADFLSALQSSGVSIKYADEFDQTSRAKKLDEGEADLMLTTLDQFLQHQPKGKIVALLDHLVGDDAVVLNTRQYPGLKSLLDLEPLVKSEAAKGKKLSIVYDKDTPNEYLALVLDTEFESFDLSHFTIKPVDDASAAWKSLQDPKENVAIAILWEPYLTQSRRAGYSVAVSTKDLPNAVVNVLVASDRLIESNPQAISKLLIQYYRRIDSNTRNASELQKQVADDGDLSAEDAATVVEGIDFFTAIETQGWFNDGLLDQRIKATANILTLSKRLASFPGDLDTLYNKQFVAEAAKNTQALINLVKDDNPALVDELTGKSGTLAAASKMTAEEIKQAPDIGNLKAPNQISFTRGSAHLTDSGKVALDQLSAELKDFSPDTVAVRIIGHTSLTGSKDSNQALSEERAKVVHQYFEKVGVALNMEAEGEGSSEPLPDTDPAAAQNQRTEIRLVHIQ